MGAIRQLTTECVVIHDGAVLFRGPSDRAVDCYLEKQRSAARASTSVVDLPRVRWCGDRSVEFVDVELRSPANHKLTVGQRLAVAVTVRAKQDVNQFSFTVTMYTNDGEPLATTFGDSVGPIQAGQSRRFELEIPDAGFAPGNYWMSMAILRSSRVVVDAIHEVAPFDVLPDGRIPSGFTEWIVNWGNLRIPMTCKPIDRLAPAIEAPASRS
jgi:hypothetical protein